jgi:hypothetical protein
MGEYLSAEEEIEVVKRKKGDEEKERDDILAGSRRQHIPDP